MKRLALALSMLCFPLFAQSQPAPFATTKLADNVYLFRYGGHQSIFVVTRAGVIATDPIAFLRDLSGDKEGQEILAILEEVLKHWDILSATAARQFLAAMALLTALLIRERRLPMLRPGTWRRLWLLGGIAMTASSMMTSLAIHFSDGNSVAILTTANPLIAILIARTVQHLSLARGLLVGTGLAVLGGLIAVLGSGGNLAGFRGGELLIIIGSAIWTWYTIVAMRWLAGTSQLAISALSLLPVGLLLPVVVAFCAATGS